MEELQELDESAFRGLREYLDAHPGGAFGIAKRHNNPPSLSKRSWVDAYMYHLLMVFARQYVTVPFTSIWVDKNQCKIPKHFGHLYIVGFGKGDCEVMIGEVGAQKKFNIKHRPLLLNANRSPVTTVPSSVDRYFLTYYVLPPAGTPPVINSPSMLDKFEAVFRDGKYVIAHHKDGEPTEYVSKDAPLWKNKQRVKKLVTFQDAFVGNESFNAAQNLLLRALGEIEEVDDGPQEDSGDDQSIL